MRLPVAGKVTPQGKQNGLYPIFVKFGTVLIPFPLYKCLDMQEMNEAPGLASGTVRQLAAIMFTDMTGYTAMMQDNEQLAMKLRFRQKDVLVQSIPNNNGKIIQYFGDGTLSLFSSAIDAVNAAITIQQLLQQEPKVKLRIGIHSGEVVMDSEGLYGDCVNLASRIESLAKPGSILISDKVYDEVKNHPIIRTRNLGKFNLKNVKRQVEVFAIANDGLVIPTTEETGVGRSPEKSIAVLPFVNMSTDPENEYFSDGISEEILNALTRVEGLQVTARTSSFSFKGKNEDIRQIGSKLGVSTVLEGSVRKSGKKLRITAQLINTADGYHIWSEVYDSDMEDIFALQDEIALKILNRLKENFGLAGTQNQIIKAPTDNVEAYNVYLKGRFHWNKSNPEEIRKALNHFEEAIRIDPEFALPYCALSFCYSFLGSAGIIPPAEAYPKAIEHTIRAIELDPNHPESHLSLAIIKFYHNWDFDGAGVSLKKALSLNLNSALINQVYGWYLIARGDFDGAIERMEQAILQDPLSLPLIANLADAYAFAGRFEEALRQYDKTLELDPNFRRAYEGKGLVYISLSQLERAIENLEIYHKMVGHPLKGLSTLGHAYALAGYTDKALDCLERLKKREEMEPGVLLYMDFAFIYGGLKDYDKAFYYLNKTYDERMGIACLGMICCIRYPVVLSELKADQRFRELTAKMKIDS